MISSNRIYILTIFTLLIISCTTNNHSQLRGAMCGDDFNEQNFIDLADMGANLVRWHFGPGIPYDPETDDISQYRDAYLAEHEETIKEALIAANACERHGMKIIVTLSGFPGWREENGGGMRMFYNEAHADIFVEAWKIAALSFKNEESIYAFDIVNEPSMNWWDKDGTVWNNLFLHTVEEIRRIDPDRTVVYEPLVYANPISFIDLELLPIDNVIYSVHMYSPFDFTHQGVERLLGYDAEMEYPGIVPTRNWEQETLAYSGIYESDEYFWDKEMLRTYLKPVIDFQKEHNVPIWVGEFSAARWAPNGSTYRYLNDCLELFEEYSWHWTYHTFRSSDIWSVEHSTDRYNYSPSDTPTDRQILLKNYFEKNNK